MHRVSPLIVSVFFLTSCTNSIVTNPSADPDEQGVGSTSDGGGSGFEADGGASDGDDSDSDNDNDNDNNNDGATESLRAFPGAQGFGAQATGGRGGRVIKVTTLASSGAGSLREALDQPEARIIVFEVSGVITGDFEIPHGDVTIAGQTAPGAGITIRGRLAGAYEYGVDNMIIRHIRVRPAYDGSAGTQFDTIQFSRNARLIFDHVSASFGVDETMDIYEARDVTVQWSTIESSATVGNPEGEHNYGLISGPDGRRVSLHHNLFAHHKNRAPAIANGPAEVVNNVMYNVRHGFVHHNPASGSFNLQGNYFKKGSATMIPFFFDDEDDFAAQDLGYYLVDNYYDAPGSACQGSIDDPWTECSQDLNAPASRRATAAFDFSGSGSGHEPVAVEASTLAYDRVLAEAGAFPRDVVTRWSVEDAQNRTGAWGAYALSDPMAGLTATSPPTDSDDDGIADSWEVSHGLDPDDASDNQAVMGSGYPAIEAYINDLAAALQP